MIPTRRIALVLCCAVFAAPALVAQPRSAAPLLRSFFDAFNSEDPVAMETFGAEGFSDDFRGRKTAEEDREFYAGLRDKLGRLTIETMMRESAEKARVGLSSDRVPMPVNFIFTLAGGKIDGFQVEVGGPPGGGREPMLELELEGNDEELASALDRQLRGLAETDRFSGVVLLARDGEPFFHRAYGLADREGGREIETTTRFDVGSITKMITKIAVAQLAQAGKVDLDAALATYLPDYPNPEVAKKITIRHLVEHSSGMGDLFGPRWTEADKSEYVEPADFFPLFADEPLQFEPGTSRAYSNAGYITLGAVVAAVSGRPYFAYVEDNVFAPAGMTRSSFPVKDGTNPELAIGYTRPGWGGGPGRRTETDSAQAPRVRNLGRLPIRGCPAGSSSHAAEDLLKLDRALRTGKLLDPEWTGWVFGAGYAGDVRTALVGIAGGGPGVSAGWESDGAITAIALSNIDPPSGERVALELYRVLAGG